MASPAQKIMREHRFALRSFTNRWMRRRKNLLRLLLRFVMARSFDWCFRRTIQGARAFYVPGFRKTVNSPWQNKTLMTVASIDPSLRDQQQTSIEGGERPACWLRLRSTGLRLLSCIARWFWLGLVWFRIRRHAQVEEMPMELQSRLPMTE